MANNYFQFKQFTLFQSKCAMKVGTDGTLLGAWATGGRRILDIGTGTGLIALMMAQRFPESRITAIDIDPLAVEQAKENVALSPFSERVIVEEADVRQISGEYDCIVSNPPFFEASLECPDVHRTIARHSQQLPFSELFSSVAHMLSMEGYFSLIIPFNYRNRIIEEAALAGFFLCRECAVKTRPQKPIRRYLMAFARHSISQPECVTTILEESSGERSSWYRSLTDSFYLK